LNILIVSAVFRPEPIVSARLSEDIAIELAVDHKVTVISPRPTRPFGFTFLSKHNSKCYSLINLNSYTCPESNLFGRFKESYSFGLAKSYLYEFMADFCTIFHGPGCKKV